MLVNVDEPSYLLRDLNMFCYRAGWTLVLSYSVEEAAEYVENLALAEHRNPMTTINNMEKFKQKRQMGFAGPTDPNKEAQRQVWGFFRDFHRQF